MGVSCQIRAAAGLALIAADPKTWMVNLTELFPPPTLKGQNGSELETFYHELRREEQEIARVLSRIYSSGWPSATSFLGGSGGMPPRKCFEMNMRCNASWWILRHNFEKCYSACTDLVSSG